MKFLKHFILLIVIISNNELYSQESSVNSLLPEDLNLYFDFEDAGSKNIKDTVLNIEGAYINGKNAASDSGRFGKCISTGKDLTSFVIKHNDSIKLAKDYSIMFWVKVKSYGTRTKLFSKRSKTKNQPFIIIGEDNGVLYAAAGKGTKDTFDFVMTTKTSKLDLNQWNHIALVFESNAKKLYLYCNGELTGDTSCPYFMTDSDSDFAIGGDFEGSGDYFDGSVDDFIISFKALNSSEISQFVKKESQRTEKNLLTSLTPLVVQPPKEPPSQAKEEPISSAITSAPTATTPQAHIQDTPAPMTKTQPATSPVNNVPAPQTKELQKTVIENTPKQAYENYDSQRNFEQLKKKVLDFYNQIPPSNVKLNIVSFYKKNQIMSHFSFESSTVNTITDELNSDITATYQPPDFNPVISGLIGNGVYMGNSSVLAFSQFKTKIPKNYSIQFSIFPLDLKSTKPFSIMALFNENNLLIAHIKILKDRIIVENAAINHETQIILTENNWQDIIIAVDAEGKFMYLFKEGFLLETLPLNIKNSTFVNTVFGRYNDIPSLDFIIDEIKFYKQAFNSNITLPEPPSNPLMSILMEDDKSILTETMKVMIFCENATEYMISHKNDFIDAKWKPLRNEVEVQPILVHGTHTLYCKFRNESNLESDIISTDYIWGSDKSKIYFINPVDGATIPGKR
ncbi:MAG: hypothetical protein ACD_79C01468G0001 [uncultured bacterium]|nr:MAG: hypothetical protein ACD_79C01468G0001 [uncultured bacterium]